MRIQWLRNAQEKFQEQLSYIAERSPQGVEAVGEAVFAAVGRFGNHPAIGRLGRSRGTRELAVPRTPYIIVYRVETEAVLILRILHGAQRWPPQPNEKQ